MSIPQLPELFQLQHTHCLFFPFDFFHILCTLKILNLILFYLTSGYLKWLLENNPIYNFVTSRCCQRAVISKEGPRDCWLYQSCHLRNPNENFRGKLLKLTLNFRLKSLVSEFASIISGRLSMMSCKIGLSIGATCNAKVAFQLAVSCKQPPRKMQLQKDLLVCLELNRPAQHLKTYAPGAFPWKTFCHSECVQIPVCLCFPSENEAEETDKLDSEVLQIRVQNQWVYPAPLIEHIDNEMMIF